jgi:phenylalanyl-tRNA synthetase alpha chain
MNNNSLLNNFKTHKEKYDIFLTTYNINDFPLLDAFHKQWHQDLKIILQGIKDLSPEDKKVIAPLIMEEKNTLEEFYNNEKIKYKEYLSSQEDENFQKYIYKNVESFGSIHPLNKTLLDLNNILIEMGFCLKISSLMVTEKENFDDLNFPENHSARDMQDTFFLTNGKILRTHTSTAQIKNLKSESIPLKIFSMGKVFRNEAVDATHNSMFFQLEVMYINKDANVLTLRGTIETILKKFFQDDQLKIRFRCSFFPFTSPSFEIDLLYKNQWLEVGGCGMIHPNVMAHNPDTKDYQGFAMGFGVDRLHMIKNNINDIRDLYINHHHLFNKQNNFINDFIKNFYNL